MCHPDCWRILGQTHHKKLARSRPTAPRSSVENIQLPDPVASEVRSVNNELECALTILAGQSIRHTGRDHRDGLYRDKSGVYSFRKSKIGRISCRLTTKIRATRKHLESAVILNRPRHAVMKVSRHLGPHQRCIGHHRYLLPL